MNLLIISHTEHFVDGDKPRGWGPTVQEIDRLATLFRWVTHLAWHVDGQVPASFLPYQAPNVSVRLVNASGGNGIRPKLSAAAALSEYARAITEETGRADAVQVRCPASISMLALLLLALRRRPGPRWFKYAGSWCGYRGEPLSYRLQRWWLRRNFSRGWVTVNGRWRGQPSHVISFLNPCLDDEELVSARVAASQKELGTQVRLLFVGRVDSEKGADRAVEIASKLIDCGIDVQLDIVGVKFEAPAAEDLVRNSPASGFTTFHGWMPRSEMGRFYSRAHFLLLPSRSEGWPKVLSEGFAYGCVPIAGAVGSIPGELKALKLGSTHDPDDIDGFVQAIERYVREPDRWCDESGQALAAAPRFGYSAFLNEVRKLLGPNDASR